MWQGYGFTVLGRRMNAESVSGGMPLWCRQLSCICVVLPSFNLTQLSPKLAAVLVPLSVGEDGVISVLLTQRSSALKSHPGQAAIACILRAFTSSRMTLR